MLKNVFIVICTSVVLALCLTSGHTKVEKMTGLGLMTGGQQGTYFQFGLNLKELMLEKGFDLSVHNSNGSVTNVYAVYKRPRTQMGIVQSDVLAFVSKVEDDPVLKQIAKKIKLVFPLYNEEIHLVGRQGVASFDDLEGKVVAIGKEGSGTYLTSKLLFKVSGVQPEKMVAVGGDDALAQVKAGTVDAMFYVAGYPVKLFSDNISDGDGLQVIPINNEKVAEFYPKSQIPGATYSWQEEAVNSVAVKAVLVSYDFKNNHCKNVGRFAYSLKENMDWLKTNGHPKWHSVDLDAPLKGWEQYGCVQKFLGKNSSSPASLDELNPVLDAIKKML